MDHQLNHSFHICCQADYKTLRPNSVQASVAGSTPAVPIDQVAELSLHRGMFLFDFIVFFTYRALADFSMFGGIITQADTSTKFLGLAPAALKQRAGLANCQIKTVDGHFSSIIT